MALTKTEVKDIVGDLYSLADDILKMKKRKKPISAADLKGFRNRALKLAVKLTIDILD